MGWDQAGGGLNLSLPSYTKHVLSQIKKMLETNNRQIPVVEDKQQGSAEQEQLFIVLNRGRDNWLVVTCHSNR